MVEFNGTLYSYVHNLQGDVVGIVDSAGSLVVEYKYDAWGKPTFARTLTTAYEALAELNPFRYRGYVYDEETGLYYLRNRYYKPVEQRFLNMDAFCGKLGALLSHNTYSYCHNTPIIAVDPNGNIPLLLLLGIGIGIVTAGVGIATALIASKRPDNTNIEDQEPPETIVPSRDYGANHTAHAGEEHKLVATASRSGYIGSAESTHINTSRERTAKIQSGIFIVLGLLTSLPGIAVSSAALTFSGILVTCGSAIDYFSTYEGKDDQYVGSYTTVVAVYERETVEGVSRYVIRQSFSTNPYLSSDPYIFTMDMPLSEDDLLALCGPSY